MKQATIIRMIITGMLAAALVVTCIAYSVAWFSVEIATPYQFEVNANGVLYVYVDVITSENHESLSPAVALPGAIEEGLYYDVLTVYDANDANPSYIRKAATVTSVRGQFDVYNEGWVYENVLLPKDQDGYTLFPKIDYWGQIVWKDDSDHSKGWETMYCYSDYAIADSGGVPTQKVSDDAYVPALTADDEIIWQLSYITSRAGSTTWDSLTGELLSENLYYCFPENIWAKKRQLIGGSAACVARLEFNFKASDDPDLNDYYDSDCFSIGALTLETEDGIPVVFTSQSVNNRTAEFEMYGSDKFNVYADVYITQPDELLDPRMYSQDVYMTIAISVEVTQLEPNE